MDIISKNPYRYLGVYSNSPTKERVANKGKMNAFLKVGKPVSFPLDLPDILPAIDRTVDSVADAEAKLTLPVDQIKYALFWFLKSTPLDDVAFNHLTSGNAEMAQSIWEKKDNVSSIQNRIVLSLICNNYAAAIGYAETLYPSFSDDFLKLIVGDAASSSVPLWQSFLDVLINDGLNISQCITNSEWQSYVGQKTVGPLIDSIAQAIATAKASKGTTPHDRLRAGQKLMASTKSTLSQLKEVLSPSDIRYQSIADKLANEILQCGIDYYNGSDDDDCAEKAMKLQKYALSVAVGQMAKDRCKENVDILQKTIDSLPPSSVMPQYRAVEEEIHDFCRLPDKICHSVTLLKNTKPHLDKMKAAISTHRAYLALSTKVVGNALHNIIEEVNVVQSSMPDDDDRFVAILIIAKLKETLKNAWEATLLMDQFDLEPDFKNNRYNKNRRILKDMCDRLNVSTSSSGTSPRVSTPPLQTSSSTSPRPTVTHVNTSTSSSTSKSSNNTNTGCLVAAIIVGLVIGLMIGWTSGQLFGGIMIGCTFGFIGYKMSQ